MIYDLDNERDQEKFKFRVNALYKNGGKVELTRPSKRKTISQNSYVHVLFDLYAVDNGYTSKESKELVKDYCPFLKYQKNGEEFTRGISELDKEDISKFIDWFRDWSGKQGCYLPEANEYGDNYNHFDNEVDKHRQYL